MNRHGGPTWRRRTTALLASAAIAVGGAALIAPPPASAAPPCYGNGCLDKDPQSTGCSTNNHQTITRFSRTTSDERYSYQLRYSTACKAVWGRYIRDDCNYPNHIHNWLRVDWQVWSLGAWRPAGTRVDDMWNEARTCNGGTGWTVMVPAHENTRARLGWGHNTGGGAPTSWGFSGWYEGGGP